MMFYLTIVIHIVLLFVFFQVFECANILILHPLYAGSHELTLRSIGNHLVKERGHNVTQILFQHTNMNVSLSTDTENLVNIVPFRIRDTKKECTRYINEDGQFDIGSFSSKLLWKYGDKPWSLPTDLFCVTRVHCNMILNDSIFFETLNASRYDIGIQLIRTKILCYLFLFLLLCNLLPSTRTQYLLSFVQYLYYIVILFLVLFFILCICAVLLFMISLYTCFIIKSKASVRFVMLG